MHGRCKIIRLPSIFFKMYLFPIKIKCKAFDNQVAKNILSEEYIFYEKYMENFK